MAKSSPARISFKARRKARRAADPVIQARAHMHESKRRRAAAEAARQRDADNAARMVQPSMQGGNR